MGRRMTRHNPSLGNASPDFPFGFGEWSAFQHDGPCCGSCIDEANEGYSQMYPLCCCRSKMDDDEATALRKRWSEREP